MILLAQNPRRQEPSCRHCMADYTSHGSKSKCPFGTLPFLRTWYNVRERKNKRLRSRHLFFAAITNEPPVSAGNEARMR